MIEPHGLDANSSLLMEMGHDVVGFPYPISAISFLTVDTALA